MLPSVLLLGLVHSVMARRHGRFTTTETFTYTLTPATVSITVTQPCSWSAAISLSHIATISSTLETDSISPSGSSPTFKTAIKTGTVRPTTSMRRQPTQSTASPKTIAMSFTAHTVDSSVIISASGNLSSSTAIQSRILSTSSTSSVNHSDSSMMVSISQEPTSISGKSNPFTTSMITSHATSTPSSRLTTSGFSENTNDHTRATNSPVPGISTPSSGQSFRSGTKTRSRKSIAPQSSISVSLLRPASTTTHGSGSSQSTTSAEKNRSTSNISSDSSAIHHTSMTFSTIASRSSRRQISSSAPSASGVSPSGIRTKSATSNLSASTAVTISINSHGSRTFTKTSATSSPIETTSSTGSRNIISITSQTRLEIFTSHTSSAKTSTSSSTLSSATVSTSFVTASCSIAANRQLRNGGFESGRFAPWAEPVFRETSVFLGVIESDTECRSGNSCLTNGIYDGSNNMFQQSIGTCANTNYMVSAYAKANAGSSQCYLQVCINNPKYCSGPIAIQETYTLAMLEFNTLRRMTTVVQVYTECIGKSNDVHSIFIDDIEMRAV